MKPDAGRLALLVLGLWVLELCVLPWVWFLRLVFFPLLLLLVFLGFQLSSGRFLWTYGLGLGLLRDLSGGGLFGAFICAYALVGWVLGSIRHLFEREDPMIQGVWAGLLTGLAGIVYGLVVTLADPAAAWNRNLWFLLPAAMLLNGSFAAWSFPALRRFLKMKGRR